MEPAKRPRKRSKSSISESTSEDQSGKGASNELNGEGSETTPASKTAGAPQTNMDKTTGGESTGKLKDDKSQKAAEPKSEDSSDKGRGRKRKASEVKSADESASEDSINEKEASFGENAIKDDLSANDSSSDLNMPPKQTLGKGKRARIPNKRYSDIMLSPSRPHKTQILENGDKGQDRDKTEKIEAEVEAVFEEVKEEPLTSSAVQNIKSRSSTSSPASKKQKYTVDLTNPNFRKPFIYGWKRELVYRATTDVTSKRNGDIYYYTPQGKKVRSMREVAENLKNKELCLEDFTFFKEPLGLNDPEKEIIRDAKSWIKKAMLPKGVRTPKGVLSPKIASPKMPILKPKPRQSEPSKVSTPPKPTVNTSAKESPAPKGRASTSRTPSNQKTKLPPVKAKSEKKPPPKQEKKETKAEPVEVEVAPPAKRPPGRKSTAKPVAPNLNFDGNKPCQPCSIRCEGVSGVVPTLQCRLCLCLYHYECVGLSPMVQVEGYVCKNCHMQHGHSVSANPPTISLPPLTHINTLKSLSTQIQPPLVPPKLQRIPKDSESPAPRLEVAPLHSPQLQSSQPLVLEEEEDDDEEEEEEPPAPKIPRLEASPPRIFTPEIPAPPLPAPPSPEVSPPPPPPPVSPPEMPQTNPTSPPPLLPLAPQKPVAPAVTAKIGTSAIGSENKSSLVGSVTSWLPHSSTIQVNDNNSRTQRSRENEQPVEAPRPQYVEYLAGRKFLIIPKHNVVSISPTCNNNNNNHQNKKITQPNTLLESSRPGGGGENSEAENETTTATVSDAADANEPKVEESGNSLEGSAAAAFAAKDIADADNDNCEGQADDKSEPAPPATPSRTPKKRGTKVNSNSVAVVPEKVDEGKITDNYMQNLSFGYNSLLYVFQYLKVQDLLRAGCVCTMWRDIASHSSLWKTVRMKNSQVHSMEGLANTLQKHGTVHLDLRKMLLPNNGGDDIWPEFSKAIEKVTTLRKIELCRCPAHVVEDLAITNPQLEVINAVTIKCESMSVDKLSALKNLKELRLKSTSGLSLSSNITALKELVQLRHLSLTSIKELHLMDLSVLGALINLESLDLAECADFPKNFGDDILVKLTKLERLRLEKGQGNCHTFEILDAVKKMPKLEQLELVNFDIKTGFDMALGACTNIKKLLIIPTYISQSATTNHMVLGGVLRLQNTLSHFVWGVTLELLRVTELFVDQCEDPEKKDKAKEKKPVGNGDSIPVLKPVPLITDKSNYIPPAHDPPQVEILPLPNLQKLLLQSLPTTRVKILKIPFHATWRQSITDTVN